VKPFPPLCGILLTALLGGAAPFASREIYTKKTDEVLILCSNGGKACADLINEVLTSLNAEAAIQPGHTYKGCAPAPLDSDQVDQVVLWILSRPQLASGYAVQDIGLAAEDLWPCK
jgi:hypothetical protein